MADVKEKSMARPLGAFVRRPITFGPPGFSSWSSIIRSRNVIGLAAHPTSGGRAGRHRSCLLVQIDCRIPTEIGSGCLILLPGALGRGLDAAGGREGLVRPVRKRSVLLPRTAYEPWRIDLDSTGHAGLSVRTGRRGESNALPRRAG